MIYAIKTDGCRVSNYSSKAWAIGGTGVTDTASGSAKEANTSNTCDGTEYSATECYWHTISTN